jgi:hypothetical protein
MKKILSLLLIFLGINLSAQIVGGPLTLATGWAIGGNTTTAVKTIGTKTNFGWQFITNNTVRGGFTAAGNFTTANSILSTGQGTFGTNVIVNEISEPQVILKVNNSSTDQLIIGKLANAGYLYSADPTSSISIYTNGIRRFNVGYNGGVVIGNTVSQPTAMVDVGPGNATLTAISLGTQVAVTSPSNGNIWYEKSAGAINGFNFYHDDATGATYSAMFKNSVFGLGIYNVATSANGANCQLVTTNTTGIGISPNGTMKLAVWGTSTTINNSVSINKATAPTKPLDVNGAAAISGSMTVAGISNSSTMTAGGGGTVITGNAGTVAVLSDVVFEVSLKFTQTSPADTKTLYIGPVDYILNEFGASNNRYVIPYDCTLTKWSFSTLNVTSNGSSESATLSVRVGNTTDNTLSSALNFSGSQDVTGTSTQTYSAGNLINGKLETPAWVTNPLNTTGTLKLTFTRR